jgi:hypothetical protein
LDVQGSFQAAFSRLPGKENPSAWNALFLLHSGANQTFADSQFVFQRSHSKPNSGTS